MNGTETQGTALHATDWESVEVDGIRGAETRGLRAGSVWRWTGPLWRLDAPPGPFRLEGAQGRAALHRVAAKRSARMMRRRASMQVVGPAQPPAPVGAEGLTRAGFTVTDGRRCWTVSFGPGGADAPRLALFHGAVPPRDVDLWVVTAELHAAPALARGSDGFAPGTRIETTRGPVPVERLRPGDAVLTDRGAAPVRAVRLRPAVGGIVLAASGLGALDHDGEITVGTQTWIGIEGGSVRHLFGCVEALVRAGDLDTLPLARPARGVDLIALSLDGAPLVMAGGMPCLAAPAARSALRQLTLAEAQIALAGAAARDLPAMALRGAA